LVIALGLALMSCGNAGKAVPDGALDSAGETGGAGGLPGTGGAGRDAAVGGGTGGAPDAAAAGSDGRAAEDAAGGTDTEAADGQTSSPCGDACNADATNNYKGSFLDSRTGLVWQKEKGAPRTNVQAARYCDTLVLDGFGDWRVPSPEELATWPNLTADSNAYVTNPTYVPAGTAPMEGCTTNSHSCNLTQYNPGSLACAWQGVAFMGPTVCVRGIATPGTTAAKYAATSCEACKPHVTGANPEFKAANCLPYAQ
jgi:hypothetical protein